MQLKTQDKNTQVGRALKDLKAKRAVLFPEELMSEAKRKQLAGIVDRKYGSTMVHVELPTGNILEGHFHPEEKLIELRKYISECFRDSVQGVAYDLILPPNKFIKDDSATFKKLSLVPATMIRWKSRNEEQQEKILLKDELLKQVNHGPFSPVT
eukprot:UN02173